MILESPFLKSCIFECSPSINVKAECSDSFEAKQITGEYSPVGGYNGRTIYERTLKDANGNWWSLRFDDSTNRWILKWQPTQIKVGEEHFGTIIENCLGKSGNFKPQVFHVVFSYSIFILHTYWNI